MIKDDDTYNTKGRKCTHFFGEPCPGRNIFNEEGEIGCPEWQEATLEPDQEGMPEIRFKGCYRLMDIGFLAGYTKRIHGAAAAVEDNRNSVDKLVNDVDEKITQGFNDMAQVLVDAVQLQNRQLQLTLFEKIEEHIPKQIKPAQQEVLRVE